MSDHAQRRQAAEAARKFDAYLDARLTGNEADASALIAACPDDIRDDLQSAVSCVDDYVAYAHPFRIRPSVWERTANRIEELRRKRRFFEELKRRASAVWDEVTTDPIALLATQIGTRNQMSPVGGLAPPMLVLNRGGGSEAVARPIVDSAWRRLREQAIGRRAQEIVDDAGVTGPPVDLMLVARDLLLLVQVRDLGTIEGCLVTDGEVGAVFLNRGTSNRRRRRYTCAHEIGHFVLHRSSPVFRDSINDLYGQPGSPTEVEANIFASMLLMPPQLVPATIGHLRPSLEQADTLTDMFEVSLEAACRRMIGLSHWRCALVVSKDGVIERAVKSDLFESYIKADVPLHRGSVAASLLSGASPAEDPSEVDPWVWVESPADDEMPIREETRVVGDGYAYSLITFVDPD